MSNNWHYAKGGEKHGPITATQLKQLVTTGQLAPDDLVWRENMTEWRKASTVKGLFPEQSRTPPIAPKPVSTSVEPAQQQQTIWEQPIVIGLLFLCFWPVGAYLLWKKLSGKSGTSLTLPNIPKKWLLISGGAMALLLVMGMILTVTQTSAARKEVAEAALLWEQGKHDEAVAIYQSVISSRGPFIPDDQEALVYGRVIDHLSQNGRTQEARLVLEKLNRLSSSVTPLVESETGRTLMADIRREQEVQLQQAEAERQRKDEEALQKKAQEALAQAAKHPVTLDKSGRADFLDHTSSYKGKAVRTECEWIGGGLRSRSTGRMTVLELDVWHESGLFHVNVRVPEELDIPNIQKADDLVVTFLCEQGQLNTGNTALKIERR